MLVHATTYCGLTPLRRRLFLFFHILESDEEARVKDNREDDAARRRRREVEERAMGRGGTGLAASLAECIGEGGGEPAVPPLSKKT